jgi:hypothetical protein
MLNFEFIYIYIYIFFFGDGKDGKIILPRGAFILNAPMPQAQFLAILVYNRSTGRTYEYGRITRSKLQTRPKFRIVRLR